MANRRRTHAELLAQLDDQIYFIDSAAQRFDDGKAIEAKLLAVHIRVLLHQTDSSHALINQLKLQDELTWVDTAGVPDPRNLISTPGLTMVMMTAEPEGTAKHVPKLGNFAPAPMRTRDGQMIERGSRIPFDEWWTNPVIKDADGAEYTRKQLILALANQEGGAHVDRQVKAAYAALVDSNSLGWVVSGGTATAPEPLEGNVVLTSVRQIAWEVLESLRQQHEIIHPS
jgi:hypothetical protein